MGNFCAVCLLPSDVGKDAFHQCVQFSNTMGSYSDKWCLDAIKHLNPPMWWKEYSSQTIELQYIAVQVLSVAAYLVAMNKTSLYTTLFTANNAIGLKQIELLHLYIYFAI